MIDRMEIVVPDLTPPQIDPDGGNIEAVCYGEE